MTLKHRNHCTLKQIKIQCKDGTLIFPPADKTIVSWNARSDRCSFICCVINAAPEKQAPCNWKLWNNPVYHLALIDMFYFCIDTEKCSSVQVLNINFHWQNILYYYCCYFICHIFMNFEKFLCSARASMSFVLLWQTISLERISQKSRRKRI